MHSLCLCVVLFFFTVGSEWIHMLSLYAYFDGQGMQCMCLSCRRCKMFKSKSKNHRSGLIYDRYPVHCLEAYLCALMLLLCLLSVTSDKFGYCMLPIMASST